MSNADDKKRGADMVSHAQKILNSKLKPRTEQDLLWEKFTNIANAIRQQIQPVLEAGGYHKDRAAINAMIHTMFLQGLDKFSKDELHQLCTSMASEGMMGSIDAAPFGGSTPDLLSGQ